MPLWQMKPDNLHFLPYIVMFIIELEADRLLK